MKPILRFSLLLFLIVFGDGCSHVKPLPDTYFSANTGFVAESNEAKLFYREALKQGSPFVDVKKVVLYSPNPKRFGQSFQRELFVTSNMRNTKFFARIIKNGNVKSTIASEKVIPASLRDNASNVMFDKPRFKIFVPVVAPDEKVELTLSFEWLDPRFLPPVFLEEEEPTLFAKVQVYFPYGVDSHFEVAKDGKKAEVYPKVAQIVEKDWMSEGNRQGLGSMVLFEKEAGLASSKQKSLRQQIFFSFLRQKDQEMNTVLDSFEKVSQHLYSRIDRYDVATPEMHDFLAKEVASLKNPLSQVWWVLTYLNEDIETRDKTLPYYEQDVFPASLVFKRRYGGYFDKVILGKALLNALGIEAEILLTQDDANPALDKAYTPYLFTRAALAIKVDNKSFFYDPSESLAGRYRFPKTLSEKRALVVRKSGGVLVMLPQ